MSHTLTETASLDTPITVPDDGDDDVTAPVDAAFGALANRTKFLLGLTDGLWLDGPEVYSTDGSTIVLPTIAGLLLGGKLFTASSNTVITPSGLTTLANDTSYYVYAYNNAGALAFEVSTTAPTANYYKTGDATRRYVCFFRTYSGSSSIRQFTLSRGFYQYRFSAMAGTEAAAFVIFSGTNAQQSGYTDINLDALVPPTARFVRVRVFLSEGTSGNTCVLSVQPSGDSGTNGVLYSTEAVAQVGARAVDRFDVPVGITTIGSHRGIQWKYPVAPPNNCFRELDVLGFLE